MLFCTCLMHFSCTFAHVNASWYSFASVVCDNRVFLMSFSCRTFLSTCLTLRRFAVCCSKPYITSITKLSLRYSSPSWRHCTRCNKRQHCFFHTKCFIKKEYAGVHSHSVYDFGVYVIRRIQQPWLRSWWSGNTTINRTKDTKDDITADDSASSVSTSTRTSKGSHSCKQRRQMERIAHEQKKVQLCNSSEILKIEERKRRLALEAKTEQQKVHIKAQQNLLEIE